MSMPGASGNAVLEEEDVARAGCYGLISRLFYAPADIELLRELGGEPQVAASGELQQLDRVPASYAEALQRLQDAARRTDAAALHQEYDDLFIGAGKALVTPYTSTYALPHAPDRHLVNLRERLARWGLKRRDSVFELEDHVSAVCDVMRWLIERGRPLDEQLGFFNEFVYSGLGPFCDATAERGRTLFYPCAAVLARSFIGIEKEAFDLQGAE